MLSGTIRFTLICAASIALTVMTLGCSGDINIVPTSSYDGAYPDAVNGGRIDTDAPVIAENGAPSSGIVVEGESVPGIALGYTRAQVEAVYGDPLWCQNVNGYDQGYCAFPVQGGGQVDVLYSGANGGPANNSPDDVVGTIRWFEAVSGWVTTAGVNTTLADEDPESAAALYPNARVTYTNWGGIYSIIDYEQGIAIYRPWIVYSPGEVHTQMEIFYPREAPPEPEKITYIYTNELSVYKSKGKRKVIGLVGVRDHTHFAAEQATVFAQWTLPDGSILNVEDVTSSSGYAYFEISNARRGTYTLTATDVVLVDHRFDIDNSILNASTYVK